MPKFGTEVLSITVVRSLRARVGDILEHDRDRLRMEGDCSWREIPSL
jgi:hypothetical protein